MNKIAMVFTVIGLGVLVSVPALAQAPATPAPTPPMTFFLTSAGSGKGADLGGIAGADARCQALATEAGAGNRTWRAYLSTQGPNSLNAKDRVGKGPWHNARGVLVGQSVEEIHSMGHRFTPMTVLDERGRMIPGSGYFPNRHDILTGSQPDGTAFPAGADMTCSNWTSSANTGKAKLGHFNRAAWNSAHDSQGCTQDQLRATGGDGLFYCFAQ